MAEEIKPQLTEEEKIARKLKFRKILSRIFLVVAVISILVFIVMMYLTRGNISTQTELDTKELRSKLRNIIALQQRYYQETGNYSEIKYLGLSKEISRYSPSIDGDFKYKFDPETGIATGMEKDASHDVNGDDDGRDGLTLSVEWEADKTDGSDFFWTDEDLADFESRKAAN